MTEILDDASGRPTGAPDEPLTQSPATEPGLPFDGLPLSAAMLDTLRQQAGSTAPELAVAILGSDGKPLGMRGRILFSGIEVDAGTGDVLLRVLVDVDGTPVSVTVESSSGNRNLDKAALQHVLKTWRFKPAMQDGQAVQAYGLVPIAFSLQ